MKTITILIASLFTFIVASNLYGSANETVLRIGVVPMASIAEVEDGKYSGFVIDFLALLSQEWQDEYSNSLTLEYSTITLQNGLESIRNGSLDTLAGGISATSKRFRSGIRFTHPYHTTYLLMLLLATEDAHIWNTTSTVFGGYIFWESLAILLLIVLVQPHIMIRIERYHNPDRFKDYWKGTAKLSRHLIGLIFPSVARGVETPKAPLNEWLTNISIIIGGFALVFIGGSLLAAILNPKVNYGIDSPYDLASKHVAVKAGTVSMQYMNAFKTAKLTTYPSTDKAFLAILDGKADILIHDAPEIESFAQRYRNIHAVGSPFARQQYIFPFSRDSPWKERFNLLIHVIQNSPQYEALCKKHFNHPC